MAKNDGLWGLLALVLLVIADIMVVLNVRIQCGHEHTFALSRPSQFLNHALTLSRSGAALTPP